MAFGTFANLAPYSAANARPAVNPLESLIQGFQQGVALDRLPETIQQDALNKQLQQEIAMAKLNQLQGGEIQNVGGNLVRINPQTRQVEVIFKPEASQEAQTFVGLTKNNQPLMVGAKTGNFSIGKLPEGVDLTGGIAPKVTPPETFQTENTAQGLVKTGNRSTTATPFTMDGSQLTAPIKPEIAKSTLVQGYDTKTGVYGGYELSDGETLPAGVVPASQVIPSVGGDGSITGTLKGDKKSALKAIPNEQVNQLSGIDVLEKRLDQIEKSPKDVRSSNVGWIDSITGSIQSATGVGTEQAIKANETFRTAVDSLIGEYSFGRGGKALTIVEREILGKYLPSLTNSDGAFESRLSTFRALTKELKEARLKALREGGYDTSRYETGGSGQDTTQTQTAAPSTMIQIRSIKQVK